jgi:hypothetical protein
VSFQQGCAFRNTFPFVSDAANDFFIFGGSGSSTPYPTLSTQGSNVGWESDFGTLDSRDRSSSIDHRLAGINFVGNSTGHQAVFRIDLPAAGNYNIRAAFGDNSSGQTIYASVLDTTTGIWFQSGTNVSAGHFIDAGGNDRTAAAWPGSNTLWPLAFSTTICRIKIGGIVGASSTTIAYFYIESAAVAVAYASRHARQAVKRASFY